MTDKQALNQLLRTEALLKSTKEGYRADRPVWRRAMPQLWKIREGVRDGTLGQKLAVAHGLLKQTDHGYTPQARNWKKAMNLIDQVEDHLARVKVPALGPVVSGDKSVLLFAPTHKTSGIKRPKQPSWYPAFDSGWRVGRKVIAPERLKVTRQSSAAGADAFYATGGSRLLWWFGHVVQAPANNVQFEKGEEMAVIARIPASQGGPHLHTGLNAMRLIGRDLRYGRDGNGPDYTYGSKTIGQQLEEALNA